MLHVAEYCNAYFCFNYVGNGLTLVVKAIVTLCMLQGLTAAALLCAFALLRIVTLGHSRLMLKCLPA